MRFMYLLLLLNSCKNANSTHAFSNENNLSSVYTNALYPDLSYKNDSLFSNKIAFSGILYKLNEDKTDTIFSAGYKNGLMHGIFRKWYSPAQLMEERQYNNGSKHGRQVSWWENGNKRFEFTAINDVYEGEMKEWSVEGKLFHLANYKHGQEEGVQKLWYDNGKLRANYVITNGRRFGLLGTKNCMNVSDSIFPGR